MKIKIKLESLEDILNLSNSFCMFWSSKIVTVTSN